MLLQYTKLTAGGVLLLNPTDLDAPVLESYLKIERKKPGKDDLCINSSDAISTPNDCIKGFHCI